MNTIPKLVNNLSNTVVEVIDYGLSHSWWLSVCVFFLKMMVPTSEISLNNPKLGSENPSNF